MSLPTSLNIHDYTYPLSPERIAQHPLPKRDDSKLLIYTKGKILHEHFYNIVEYFSPDTLLFFNDTKVIPARLHFQKATGAAIEIFLLNPIKPSPLLIQAMQSQHACTWKCTIGNLKRWTSGTRLSKQMKEITLKAELTNREEGLVEFTWDGDYSFAEVISIAGETPLPPYLKRKAESTDRERYQTIYSHYEGAVAAPTAGLHFTENTFEALKKKGIQTDFLTLHVSAGTFQPVKTENASAHVMHQEQIIITRNNIENLSLANKFIVPVGTTSMRTLESLYWFGAKLLKNSSAEFKITQHDPYTYNAPLPSKEEALRTVAEHLNKNETDTLIGETSIYIMPGYKFKICNGLITNFHQPASTLMLLVAAFVGPAWRRIYDEALKNNYRFLSYGDSSLLIP